jgi:hypothetical protein
MCAAGLPRAEKLKPARLLNWLDDAARHVGLETRRHWYRFDRSPGTYKNSPGYFCCYFLLQVLQEDFRVRYNPARVRDPSFQDPKCLDPDFRDSQDLFIHGIIDGDGGTCASMPVLYVAVGRRLGYPVKLVEGRGHLFFRWDDPTGSRFHVPECFNIEGTGNGIGSYPDEHYRTWPEPWNDAEKAAGVYLKSLEPARELAGFLGTRGECLADNNRLDEAIQAYRWAVALSPRDPRYTWRLQQLVRKNCPNILEIQEMIAFGRAARARSRPQSFGFDIVHSLRAARARSRPQTPPAGALGSFPLIQGRTGFPLPFDAVQHGAPSGATTRLPGHTRNCQCYQCRPPGAMSQIPPNPLHPR